MRRARSAASCAGPSAHAEAAARRSRWARPPDQWEVSMLAEISGDATRGEGLLRERRERTERGRPARGAEQTGAGVERDVISVAHDLHGIGGFDHRDAQINAVTEEDAGEALRDDRADAELLQCRDRVLARRAAAEVLAADENVARPHLLREAGARVAERVGVELVLADHERRVAAGDHLVGIEVVAEDPGARHQSSISIAGPLRALAITSSRERSPERDDAAPRSGRSPRRRATSSSNSASVASRYGRGSSMTPVSAATAATYGEPMKIDASGEPIRPL